MFIQHNWAEIGGLGVKIRRKEIIVVLPMVKHISRVNNNGDTNEGL